MAKSKSGSTSKRSRPLETTISLDSSISSISSRSGISLFSTCCFICAFLSVAIISSILTYAATISFYKCKEPVNNEEIAKIGAFMQKMDNWFVSHNYFYVAPDSVESPIKCTSSACDYKKGPPNGGWPKLPEYDWKEMNESPYPIPENVKPCSIVTNFTTSAN